MNADRMDCDEALALLQDYLKVELQPRQPGAGGRAPVGVRPLPRAGAVRAQLPGGAGARHPRRPVPRRTGGAHPPGPPERRPGLRVHVVQAAIVSGAVSALAWRAGALRPSGGVAAAARGHRDARRRRLARWPDPAGVLPAEQRRLAALAGADLLPRCEGRPARRVAGPRQRRSAGGSGRRSSARTPRPGCWPQDWRPPRPIPGPPPSAPTAGLRPGTFSAAWWYHAEPAAACRRSGSAGAAAGAAIVGLAVLPVTRLAGRGGRLADRHRRDAARFGARGGPAGTVSVRHLWRRQRANAPSLRAAHSSPRGTRMADQRRSQRARHDGGHRRRVGGLGLALLALTLTLGACEAGSPDHPGLPARAGRRKPGYRRRAAAAAPRRS